MKEFSSTLKILHRIRITFWKFHLSSRKMQLFCRKISKPSKFLVNPKNLVVPLVRSRKRFAKRFLKPKLMVSGFLHGCMLWILNFWGFVVFSFFLDIYHYDELVYHRLIKNMKKNWWRWWKTLFKWNKIYVYLRQQQLSTSGSIDLECLLQFLKLDFLLSVH